MQTYAVVENNIVVNVVVGIDAEELAAHPDRYIETTNGWPAPKGIDGGAFFPTPLKE